jgi:streptogramin lyase
MPRSTPFIAAFTLATFGLAAHAQALDTFSWRYYRTGNTGIQGDFNQAIAIDPDGNPWIGGYSPSWEEGGVAKFIVAENRWENISNIDYPVIGHPEETGCSRITDIIRDADGNLWMGTYRGVLRMDPNVGPASITRWAPGDSALPGGLTRDMTLAPDGTIWVSAESTEWAGGGLSRFHPATGTWSHVPNHGGSKIAAQAKPTGGYFLWAGVPGSYGMHRWDSSTGQWKVYPTTVGQPTALISSDSVDEQGHVWMLRSIGSQGEQTLDCIRPNGTWVSPPLPPLHPMVPVAALRAFGSLQAIMVDGFGTLQRFDGRAWTDLGPVPYAGFIDDLEIAPDGTVWLCGISEGGAFRRDPLTGLWQRYRITNTSQFESFTNDLAIDPVSGDVYATANAGTGLGGMVRFDGTRWTGFNQHTYGLGVDWPFDTDNSEAVCVRSADGSVIVNPYAHFTSALSWSGETPVWTPLDGGPDQIAQYAEDSLGRMWAIGHYGGFGRFIDGSYEAIATGGWGIRLEVDPSRTGSVWANLDWKLVRTDGVETLERTVEDFPAIAFAGPFFQGLAIEADGSAWVGCGILNSTGEAGGGLLRIDGATGLADLMSSFEDWPFPGEAVYPHVVTPDGKLWLSYEGGRFPNFDFGLCWYDGTDVGVFPAPAGGEPQWGGLPHAAIKDLEVKLLPNGYELWMSCLSRGIAVLSVTGGGITGDLDGDGAVGPQDLSMLLGAWGTCEGNCAADLDGDGLVGASDLAALLGAWS